MEWINTVTGQITAQQLGLTLVHEHLLIGFPGWQMDTLYPFRREEALARAVDALTELRAFGVRSFVDPCPSDLGRDVEFMAEVAQRSGMQIICAAGAYKEDQGNTYTFGAMSAEQICEIYVRELTEGIGLTGIRAGLLKVATGTPAITAYEHKLLLAAGQAAVQTGCSVLTHTDHASLGVEQIAVLTGVGVPAHRILVGHSDGRADHAYHVCLAERQAYVGFDRFGIESFVSDQLRIEGVLKLIEAGYLRSLCLSQDATCGAWLGRPSFDGKRVVSPERLRQAMPSWEVTHLFKRILPRMAELGVTQAQIDTMLVDNPARFFRGEEPPTRHAH
jgi:phosphotriesterase-related protein